MDDALLMRVVDRGADLFEDVHDPVQGQPVFFSQHVTQSAAVEIFHYQVGHSIGSGAGKTEVGNINHVRMAETSGGAGFALEPLDKFFVAHELRSNQFQSYVSFSAQVVRQVHRTHAA